VSDIVLRLTRHPDRSCIPHLATWPLVSFWHDLQPTTYHDTSQAMLFHRSALRSTWQPLQCCVVASLDRNRSGGTGGRCDRPGIQAATAVMDAAARTDSSRVLSWQRLGHCLYGRCNRGDLCGTTARALQLWRSQTVLLGVGSAGRMA
jgi:hypothetical protein